MRWTRLAVCRCITALSFALPGLGVAAGSAFAHGDPRHDLAPSEPAVLTPLTPRARVMPDRGAAGFFQPRRYYLANDDHSDYLWSGDAATYRSAFNTMLDYYMTLAESTASNPPDARGRFNADGTLWVSEYEATHTPAQFQRLIGHIRAGDITVPINTCVQLYGAMPAEAVIRSFQYAGRLSRREGLTFPLVVPMENQTLPGGVAALWAGSGVRYSWKGICNCATTIDATDRLLEVYRFGGKDGSSVLMKWNSELYGSSYSVGGYAEALNPTAALNLMKNNSTYRARWPYDISAAFGYGWDSLQTTTPKFVQAALTLNDDTTRVIDSNEVDFFQDFEINYGLGLPTYTASYGNEWDLFSASLGEVTASVKRSFEKLRTAEALATIASFYDPAFMSARVAKRDSMTMAAGLYYEHSWGPGPGVNEATRDAWQRRIASAITAYVDTLHDNGLARLGTLVPAGALERHVVFNPLSWPRTDVADLAVTTVAPFKVVDLVSGFEVPSQAVTVGGLPRVRILATNVPSVGYRVYEVRPGAGASYSDAAIVTGGTLDNGIYRITLGSRGQITSFVDHKDADRQLVGGSGAIHDFLSGSGAVTVEAQGPVSTTLQVVASGLPDHETRVTLHRGLDRVDVDGRVTENFGDLEAYESTFALPGMTMRHEEVGMIATVARLSQGGDYAEANTRTDYLTFNHFVDLSQAARGVTISSPDCGFFRAGNSTITSLDGSTPKITAVVGMQVDGPGLGIANQGGDSFFLDRFGFRTHTAYDPAAAMRFALEHQSPLVATRVSGTGSAPLQPTTWSLLGIDNPDVILWALKPAEEGIGNGVIARVWNLSESPRTMNLSWLGPPTAVVRRVTHIETDLSSATFGAGVLTAALTRQQLQSFRLQIATPTAVTPAVPAVDFALSAYPNPTTGAAGATLRFRLSSASLTRVSVFDVRGREIARPHDGLLSAGEHTVRWDARGRAGERIPAGVYLVRVDAGSRSDTKRLVIW